MSCGCAWRAFMPCAASTSRSCWRCRACIASNKSLGQRREVFRETFRILRAHYGYVPFPVDVRVPVLSRRWPRSVFRAAPTLDGAVLRKPAGMGLLHESRQPCAEVFRGVVSSHELERVLRRTGRLAPNSRDTGFACGSGQEPASRQRQGLPLFYPRMRRDNYESTRKNCCLCCISEKSVHLWLEIWPNALRNPTNYSGRQQLHHVLLPQLRHRMRAVAARLVARSGSARSGRSSRA